MHEQPTNRSTGTAPPRGREHELNLVRTFRSDGVSAACKCGWYGAEQASEDGAQADYASHVAFEAEARDA